MRRHWPKALLICLLLAVGTVLKTQSPHAMTVNDPISKMLQLPDGHQVPLRPVRHVAVYQNHQLVLMAEDKPGVILSTAFPSPDGPPKHAFMTAQATWAEAEDELGSLIHSTADFDGFLAALLDHRCDIRSIDAGTVPQRLEQGWHICLGDSLIGVVWNAPGQFMTLSQQPMEGHLQSKWASMTVYDEAYQPSLLAAFTKSSNSKALLHKIEELGLTMVDI
jgi:hypothetical protein